MTSDITPSEDPSAALFACLVTSAEPAVVLASLAALSVRALCDRCTIDVEDDGAQYRIVAPFGAAHREPALGAAVTHSLHVPFAVTSGRRYRGVATFDWRHAAPDVDERRMAEHVVAHATATVARQRASQDARDAAATAHHRVPLAVVHDIHRN